MKNFKKSKKITFFDHYFKHFLISAGGDQEQSTENSAAQNTRRAVEREEAQAYSNENKLIFYETSAKTGEMVHDLFLQIAQDLPKEQQAGRGQGQAANRRVDLNAQNNNNQENPLQKCCNSN